MTRMGQMGQNREKSANGAARRRNPPWKWIEVEAVWAHPEMTAAELHELVPGHTVEAIRRQRSRMGRFGSPRTCCRCDGRPVWEESPKAKRYGLCKGCWLDEERMRLEEEAEAARVRQMRSRAGRGGVRGGG